MNRELIHIAFLLFCALLFGQQEKLTHVEEIDEKIQNAINKVNAGDASTASSELEEIKREAELIQYELGVIKVISGQINVKYHRGDFEDVIELCNEGEPIAEKLGLFDRQADFIRMRATSRLELGLTDLANEELRNALSVLSKADETSRRHFITALVYDNIGGTFDDILELDSVIYYKRKSIDVIEKISDDDDDYHASKYSLLAFQNMNLGIFYSQLEEFETAESHFLKSMALHEQKEGLFKSEEIILLSEIAGFYNKQGDNKKALTLALKGLGYEKKTSFPKVRRNLYETLSTIYLEENKREEAKKYTNLYKELSDSIDRVNKSTINKEINKKIDENRSEYEQSKRNSRIKLLMTGLLSTVVLLLVWQVHVRRIRKKYEKIISQLKVESNSGNSPVEMEKVIAAKISNSQKSELEELGMTEETLKELMEKLKQFENQNKYIEPDVNLPYLVNYLGTNSKYLSYILKNEKKKSFNQYVNDLRIDYLIETLYNNPKYLEYKIDYLAEMIGFQSRSAFNNSFKKKTGITPYYFIKKLQLEFSKEK